MNTNNQTYADNTVQNDQSTFTDEKGRRTACDSSPFCRRMICPTPTDSHDASSQLPHSATRSKGMAKSSNAVNGETSKVNHAEY